MRSVLLAGFLACAMTSAAQGQELAVPTSTSAQSVMDSRFWSDVPLSRSSVATAPRRVHYCCNGKHALIGAGIGAAIGFAFVRAFCPNEDCTTDYIKSMAVMGGILGGLGAFVSRQNPGVPLAPPTIENR